MPTHDPTLNLLTEPLLRVRRKDGETAFCTLPGLLAALGRREVESFPGLRAHQGHAWHAFLVQLAAIAINRLGHAATEIEWRERLRSLTEGADEPWCLVVPDLSKPAFMQPPVPEGNLSDWKESRSPDETDTPVTSKNHDVKMRLMSSPAPEHWAFSLISLQTMQGYSGPRLHGIARMNSGKGSRPCVGFATGIDASSRFTRDITAVLSGRESILSTYAYPDEGGKALLWITPWTGENQLALSECDPLFIEICRRVRLQTTENKIHALSMPTGNARISAKESKGNTGDPWTPVKDGAALTMASGFNYSRLQELLFGSTYRPGAAFELLKDDPETLLLSASVSVRGDKTKGFHERILPIPGKIRRRLASKERREELGRRSKARVEKAATVRLKVLKPALCALLQGGPTEIDWQDERPQRFLDRFDAEVDGIFFEALWANAEAPGEEDVASWERTLAELARRHLEAAFGSVPLSSVRRYRAQAAAQRIFDRMRHSHLPASSHRPAEGAAS